MITQLMKDASIEELKNAGLSDYYTTHKKGIFPSGANGVPFTTAYISSSGNAIVDLAENMAAEEKARATYENLIDLTDDPDVIGPLLFLRQREIIHFTRFQELYNEYKKKNLK